MSAGERQRLAPDLASWSVGAGPAGRGLLGVRRRSRVVVEGAGRLGALLVTLLAAAAVGRLDVTDGEQVHESDLGPGGHERASVGAGRAASAARHASAVAPSARVGCARSPVTVGADPPDLVVLSPDGPAAPPGRCEQLLAAGPRTCWRRPTSGSPWSDHWCCPAARRARHAWTCTAWTGTVSGRSWPRSCTARRPP